MPSQIRKYNLKRIRRNYTYSVTEIAELFSVSNATVRRWIADEGLMRIPQSKKYFVHGSQLSDFLGRKNTKNKRPCGEGEIYCCKCRAPRHPQNGTVKCQNMANGTVRVMGRCRVCNTAMNKVISGKKWNKDSPLYHNINAEHEQHNGKSLSLRECKEREEAQLCLNLTL